MYKCIPDKTKNQKLQKKMAKSYDTHSYKVFTHHSITYKRIPLAKRFKQDKRKQEKCFTTAESLIMRVGCETIFGYQEVLEFLEI